MPVVGPIYTNAQLRQIWINAGGNPLAAPTAAAVAQAESGGGVNSYNTNKNGSTDKGLWQINSVHGTQSTFDVQANARAAVAISNNGQNWKPWTTFNSGAYIKFLNGAVGGNVGGGVAPTGTANAGLVSAVTGIDWVHTVDVIGNWLAYSAIIALGGILFAAGTVMLFKGTPAAAAIGHVTRAAKSVIPT